MILALLLALAPTVLTWDASPDPRVVSYDCEAWHRSVYPHTPTVQVECRMTGAMSATIPSPRDSGWIAMFCVYGVTTDGNRTDCADSVTR